MRMNRVLSAVLLILIGLNGWYAWYQWERALPTKTALDGDISAVESEIASAQSQSSSYAQGSLLQVLVSGRLEVLNATKAMLDQKRVSVLRGIAINYTLEGSPWSATSPDELKLLEDDLAAQKTKAREAEAKATVTAGLLAVLASVDAGIEQMTEAMLRQRYLAAKYGLPYGPAASQGLKKQRESLGNVVKDSEGGL
jgi:hypothetical protein